MSQLVISNGSASNPQSIDLTQYMDVNEGQGMDLADPAFTNRVWSRSLLKHGATLALEQLVEKELTFPLKIGPIGGLAGAPTTLSQTLQFVQSVNMILETPGATVTWQPVGASQATTFDLLTGQLEIAYNYRAEQQKWTFGNLRLFTLPLGRTAAPRPYAAASAVGPLLMISPYASVGAQAIGASTQAGVAGYGGQQQGASSGVFYWGSPSLAGDAPALLQVSYSGPVGNSAGVFNSVPYVAVGLLPDANYHVLFTAASPAASGEFFAVSGVPTQIFSAQAVASCYVSTLAGAISGVSTTFALQPNMSNAFGASVIPPLSWAGQHRLFAIARASGAPAALSGIANAIMNSPATATVYPGDWQLQDLGTFTLRASEVPGDYVMFGAGGVASSWLDVTAVAMLPDNATWYLNPTTLGPTRTVAVGGGAVIGLGQRAFTNTVIIDDIIGDQFLYTVASTNRAPSPAGAIEGSLRLTQFTRGLVPQPDPKNGLPIIAILGVGQPFVASTALHASASWQNPQNLLTSAQVSALERFRYVAN